MRVAKRIKYSNLKLFKALKKIKKIFDNKHYHLLMIIPFQYSPVAQSVEQLAVNQLVVGSSPTGGAKVRSSPHKWEPWKRASERSEALFFSLTNTLLPA